MFLQGEKMEPGKPGMGMYNATGWMSGEWGKDGEPGRRAGAIFLLFGESDFAAPLVLSAVGGGGGDGQPGQDGADGGDGGKGFDATAKAAIVGTYQKSTAGGDGGMGGRGGTGGRGGKGGDGGKIIIHSLWTSPAITTAYEGGKGGAPGAAGKGGEKGLGGVGGASTWLAMTMGPGREIPGSPNGKHGEPGDPGQIGQEAPASQSGSASVTSGKVSNEILAQLASASQLQMLFERIRADYLVTEPARYDLCLQSVLRTKDIVAKGRNLVVAAAVGSRLHVRVFDSNGTMAVDKPEGALAGAERLAALKETLKALKLNFRRVMEMTPRTVLLAGKWATEDDLKPKGGWRNPTDFRTPDDEIRERLVKTILENSDATRAGNIGLTDSANLAGIGAVIVFLRDAGVCDRGTLQRMTIKQQKETLISEIQRWTGKRYEDLAGLPSEWLLEIGVEFADVFHRDERATGISDQDKQSIFEDLAFLLGDADCLTWYRLGGRLSWVVGILDKIPDDHPQKHLARKICQSAWTAHTNYNMGLDYYGKTPRFAPILSLDTYLTALESSLQPLKAIEEKVNLYFSALRDQKDAMSDLQASVDQTAKVLALLNTRKQEIVEKKNRTSETIERLDNEVKSARGNLKAELDGLKVQVKGAFGLSLDTFFNCLFQLAFINVHEPANALDMGTRLGMAGGAGLAQAGMMATSQLGLMMKEATENVLTKSGERINKDWMLEQIEVVKEDADLQAEFTKREDGMFSKEGSARLLVELDKFRALCKQFYGSLADARKVRGMLDSYIETITDRNRHIDYYNMLVAALLDLSAEVDRLNLQRTAVQGAIASKTQPGLPSMAAFVSGLYERAKAICLSDLYHAYRAYAFWALAPYSGFYDRIGRNPGAINYDLLNIAKSDLRNDILQALGSNYRTPNRFPPREESERSIGRVVVLTRKIHPEFFDDLEDSEEAEFELEPATRGSVVKADNFAPTIAAWCGPKRPHFAANPFAGMADVRLTKVRAWLVGPERKLDHKVILTHLGREQFRRPDDQPYPTRLEPAEENDQDKRKPQYIEHEEVPIPFNYNAEGLSYDEDARSFTPGRLFGAVAGAQDGDLPFPRDGISDLPAAGKYAPIGPFGRWRLEVPKNLNQLLELSDVHAVVIDFHGFHQTYAKKPLV